MIKETGVGKQDKSNVDKLVDEGINLNVPRKGTKSSLLVMVILIYMGNRNSLPFWVKA